MSNDSSKTTFLSLITFVALYSFSSCSTFTKEKISGVLGSAFASEQKICHEVLLPGQPSVKTNVVICSDQYPLLAEGDVVILHSLQTEELKIEVPKYKDFETFFDSLSDKRAISAFAFEFFARRGQVSRLRYKQEWESKCEIDGLYCRLLAYLDKSKTDDASYYRLMRKGCDDLDIISCFNLIAAKEIKSAEEKKIKRKIRSTCATVLANYNYQDFCNDLLNVH